MARVRASRLLALGVLAALVAGCGGDDGTRTQGDAGLRVLFVGNSLTATNDLPGVVARIAARHWLRPMEVETVAPGGVSLEEHWSETGARELFETGSWDVVVLQQGPSTLPESRAHLRRWAVRWAELARTRGARPALLGVWPEQARVASFPQAVRSYAAAAQASDAVLLPAGAAWQEALARDPSLPLHGADGLHPSPLGTALAAVVVYAGLAGIAPGELPLPLSLPGIDDSARETARLVREAAAAALAGSRR